MCGASGSQGGCGPSRETSLRVSPCSFLILPPSWIFAASQAVLFSGVGGGKGKLLLTAWDGKNVLHKFEKKEACLPRE